MGTNLGSKRRKEEEDEWEYVKSTVPENKKWKWKHGNQYLSRCWSVAESRWQIFVVFAAFGPWAEMQLDVESLLWRRVLEVRDTAWV